MTHGQNCFWIKPSFCFQFPSVAIIFGLMLCWWHTPNDSKFDVKLKTSLQSKLLNQLGMYFFLIFLPKNIFGWITIGHTGCGEISKPHLTNRKWISWLSRGERRIFERNKIKTLFLASTHNFSKLLMHPTYCRAPKHEQRNVQVAQHILFDFLFLILRILLKFVLSFVRYF